MLKSFGPPRLSLTALCCGFLLQLPWLSNAAHLTPVRVLFLTDCTPYSHWMSLGMQFSFKMSGQPGKVTRVACCTDKEKEAYPKEFKDSVDTWIAPSMAIHPRNGDAYPPYNKPEAVIDYLLHNTPEEEYILVLDSDMVLRRPFLVEMMQPRKGLAVGAKYGYMIGVGNELAPRHIPEVAPRNDTRAGPMGRLGDQVGGFFFIHRDDLKRMSPLWLKYTEDVRFDDMAYKYSGDVYATKPGDKPWISEMYGYAFGAAKADVWHKWDTTSMIYPGYEPAGIPKLMHYGLRFNVNKFSFDKHSHFDFDALKCPPWKEGVSGIFQFPPRVAELTSKDERLSIYYRDLLIVETVMTVNAGLCDFHLSHCSPSKALFALCNETWDRYEEVTAATRRVEDKFKCLDQKPECADWAKQGECDNNIDFMQSTCTKSCKFCADSKDTPVGLTPASVDLPTKLQKMATQLGSALIGSTTSQSASSMPSPVALPLPQASVTPLAAKAASQIMSPPPAASPQPPALSPPPPSSPPPEVIKPPPFRFRFTFSPYPPPPPSPPWNTPLVQNNKVHCYRMALELAEVKACIEAAKKGEKYEPKPMHGDRALSSEENLAAALGVSAVASPPMAGLEESIDSMGQQIPIDTIPSFPVLVIEVVAGIALIMCVSRLYYRMRRKAKSGMRSE